METLSRVYHVNILEKTFVLLISKENKKRNLDEVKWIYPSQMQEYEDVRYRDYSWDWRCHHLKSESNDANMQRKMNENGNFQIGAVNSYKT